jgi:curli biogenesis system outer membrane secretion channel CsgG
MKTTKIISLLTFLVFVAGACGPKPEVYFRREISFGPSKTIAILPFNNYSGQEDAGKQVSNMFLVEFLKKPYFNVLEPGEVDRIMREERIRSSEQIDFAAAKVFKDRLAADYILIGAVNEFGYLTRGEREVPLIGFSVRLLDTGTGQIVWAANHSRKGDDRELLFGWGLVKSLTKLAQISVGEVTHRIKIEH